MSSEISPFLDAAKRVTTVKQVETVLPVARTTAVVSPVMVGDDLQLRTAVTSPINYDKQLTQLLFDHTQLMENEQSIKDFNTFCSRISNIDKLSLMWAMYKASYDYLTKGRTIRCDNEQCNNDIKTDIYLDDLIHEDTFAPWEEQDPDGNFAPFYDFRYPISVEYADDYYYEFLTKLPSIKDNNDMLGMISTDVLQHNLDTIGHIFTRPQQMAPLIQAIRLSSKSGQFETAETSSMQEILITLQKYIPKSVSDEFFRKYGEKFDQYVPDFYILTQCPSCGKEVKYSIDMEVEFFRRNLLDED